MVEKDDSSRREDLKGYENLEALALDFSSSWKHNHSADTIWMHLDPYLWKLTRNPWVVLQTCSKEKLAQALADPIFSKIVDDHVHTSQMDAKTPAWFQKKYPAVPLSCIAYFSMEFMLEEALPIYSGGLGNVAGDQLKAASDLGVPVIGIGILYQQGYFRQAIDPQGAQHALYPYNDPSQLPIKPLRKLNGEWLRLEVMFPGGSVWLRAWEVKIGRVKLYLLDSNDLINLPVNRGITSELYGGDKELRLKQEIVLGIGGMRLLESLGIHPDVCHLNEGHAAFAILERAYYFMKETGQPFDVALAVTKAGNLFTTHTAVPAGFDRFPTTMIEHYFDKYTKDKLGIPIQDLLALGRLNPNDSAEDFSMAYLAIRGSGAINAVSQLHGKVSRQIFATLFPHWPEDEVPVGHVTNGVHVPSWGSVKAGEVWQETCGVCYWEGAADTMEKDFRNTPEMTLWNMRYEGRKALINYIRARLSRMMEARREPPHEVERTKHIFDPNIMTIGFARRFATYKRSNILLHDRERLLRILTNPQRPVQLVFAGKAHPADLPGQAMIQEWMRFIWWKPEVRAHVVFLSDYDMHITQQLVQGVDLWINTPRRPWEACGTSGMKVLINGGLNLSELDGWWVEAYTPEVGWALGDGNEHGDNPEWDEKEANQLYNLLEKEVIPEFYTKNDDGLPTEWIKKMKESMTNLTPKFSSDRAVRDYTELHYIPAAINYHKRSEEKGAFGKKMVYWQRDLYWKWPSLRFETLRVETKDNEHTFEVGVYLNDIEPNFLKIELYANGSPPIKHDMKLIRELPSSAGFYIYRASIPSSRPAADYTPRIIPFFEGVNVPLEANQILWQK